MVGVLGGECVTAVATPADAGEFCILFKLSRSELVLGAGREFEEEAVPDVRWIKVKEG